MSEKKEQSAERCVHGVKLINVCTECLQQRLPQLLKPVEQPAASPAQLSARELAYSFACSLVDEGLIRAADCPEVTERLEAYRDASQRQPSESSNITIHAEPWKFSTAAERAEVCGPKSCPCHEDAEDWDDSITPETRQSLLAANGELHPLNFADAYAQHVLSVQPQSVSEEQLQKAADKIVFYLAQLHNAGMLSYVKPPTIISILKSAFKEEL